MASGERRKLSKTTLIVDAFFNMQMAERYKGLGGRIYSFSIWLTEYKQNR